MKNLLVAVVGALAVAVTLPVSAEPNWQVIEQAQKTRAARIERNDCRPPLVLPLDHGPCAQATPWENERRKARYEERVKACMNAQR